MFYCTLVLLSLVCLSAVVLSVFLMLPSAFLSVVPKNVSSYFVTLQTLGLPF